MKIFPTNVAYKEIYEKSFQSPDIIQLYRHKTEFTRSEGTLASGLKFCPLLNLVIL